MENKPEDYTNQFYSINSFLNDLKKSGGVPELETELSKKYKTLNNPEEIPPFNQPQLNCISEVRSKKKQPSNFLNLDYSNVNEVMKSELINLSKENSELKFCLNNMNKKFERELNEIRKISANKSRELSDAKEIIKKNVTLIEVLGQKIFNYEKIFTELNTKKLQQKNMSENYDNVDYETLQKENEELKIELNDKNKIIEDYQHELNSKKEISDEVEKMKKELETYLKTMDKLYKEIENKHKIIESLKKNMQLIQKNHELEIGKIKISNQNSSNPENKKLIDELMQKKNNEVKLNQDLIELQKKYEEAKNKNLAMQKLTKEANKMIKDAIDSRDNIKNQYDSAIKDIVEKYEKQIQVMKILLVKQDEMHKKSSAKNNVNNSNGDLEKLQTDNKMLLEQNEELKNMNTILMSKMKELPDLDKKFNELFQTVQLLREENEILKKTPQCQAFLKIGENNKEDDKEEDIKEDNKKEDNKEDNKEEDNKKENIEDENNNENNDDEENKKLLESIDINDLKLLESILKAQVNENQENDAGNSLDNLNLKEKLLLKTLLDSMQSENQQENENEDENNNNEKEVEEKDKDTQNKNEINTNKVYNKKIPKSPLIAKNKTTDNKEKNNIDTQNEEEISTENIQNQINENFNLYKPTKEGILSFNLSKKAYSFITPVRYEEFLEVFDQEKSVQYNTLEGLFIIPSDKNNQLFYFSSKKNTISELFKFSENHSGGCLFLDNNSRNVLVLGGENSKLVEKFSFESGELELLPELPNHRSKMSCCQVGNIIYCFFGICPERPGELIIEFLDMDNLQKGWEEVKFENKTNFESIYGMSCINLNDNEFLIIGGMIGEGVPNEKLLYYNIEQKEFIELEKNLPESENKCYLFTQNTMFNLFVNGEMISFTNIDDNNQVHVLDNELRYDLYLVPKEN